MDIPQSSNKIHCMSGYFNRGKTLHLTFILSGYVEY